MDIQRRVVAQYFVETVDGSEEGIAEIKNTLSKYGCDVFHVEHSYDFNHPNLVYRVEGFVTEALQ